MGQIHKRFTTEQVKVLLKGYCQGTLDRQAIEETLGISKTRFFALLRQYRHNADDFSPTYQRSTPTGLPACIEREIERELMLDEGNSLFRPFALPKPYTSAKDVFCLREKRMVDGYRRISLLDSGARYSLDGRS